MSKSNPRLFQPGLNPDVPDGRDYRHTGLVTELLTIPKPDLMVSKVDWSQWMTDVKDQETEGSCVGFATVAAIEALENRKKRNRPDLSEEMAYNYARKYDDFPGENYSGTTVKGCVKAIHKHGVCEEKYWRYNPKIVSQPHYHYLQNARRHKIVGYTNVARKSSGKRTNRYAINAYDVARALKKSPVVAGFFIDESMSYIGRNGIISIENVGNRNWGHAMCLVSYNPMIKMFKIKNSWGKLWGNYGYGYMHLDVLQKCIISAWTISI